MAKIPQREQTTLCIRRRDVYLSKLLERNAMKEIRLEWRTASKANSNNSQQSSCSSHGNTLDAFMIPFFSLLFWCLFLLSSSIHLCVILI